MSSLKPSQNISAKQPNSEIGSDTTGMAVADKRLRNRKITSTTSTMVRASVNFTSWIASRIEIERSLSTLTSIDAGICDLNCGSVALTASTTATVLALGWRCTPRMMDGSPLALLPLLTDSTQSSTTARSFRRVVNPSCVLITRLANAGAGGGGRGAAGGR